MGRAAPSAGLGLCTPSGSLLVPGCVSTGPVCPWHPLGSPLSRRRFIRTPVSGRGPPSHGRTSADPTRTCCFQIRSLLRFWGEAPTYGFGWDVAEPHGTEGDVTGEEMRGREQQGGAEAGAPRGGPEKQGSPGLWRKPRAARCTQRAERLGKSRHCQLATGHSFLGRATHRPTVAPQAWLLSRCCLESAQRSGDPVAFTYIHSSPGHTGNL